MKQNETARYYIHRAEKIFRTVLISDVGGWWWWWWTFLSRLVFLVKLTLVT